MSNSLRSERYVLPTHTSPRSGQEKCNMFRQTMITHHLVFFLMILIFWGGNIVKLDPRPVRKAGVETAPTWEDYSRSPSS